MDLPSLDEIDAAARVRRTGGQRCDTCAWLSTLPDDYRAKFEEMMADREIQGPAIYEQMRRCGFTKTKSAFDNHRRTHVG